MARVKFKRFLDKNDFGMGVDETDISLSANKWTEIGSYQVPAQQEIAFGVGKTSEGGVDSRRTATIDLHTTSGSVMGNSKIRLAYADANAVTVQPIQEDLTSNWASGESLGEVENLRVREDSFLKILALCTSATTWDASDTDNQADIPVTVYML